MAEVINLADFAAETCWQCGAPAPARSACSISLVAGAKRQLAVGGHVVKRGKREDTVRIRVPRCPACRRRNLVAVAAILAAAAAGAIAATLVQPAFWPVTRVPGPLAEFHTLGSPAPLVGALLGFLAALLANRTYKTRRGLRPINAYPPLRALRQSGWHTPSD